MKSNFWEGKSVLITGAGGFIGSHLTETLLKKGANVRVFVRYNSRGDLGLLHQLPATRLDSIEINSGDLRDPQAVHQAVRGIEMVFHLGALVSIPYSYRHPFEVSETNFMGTLNVLFACRDLEAKLIHTSTSEVYGTAQKVPIDESHPLQGQSPYSASKIGADKLVESFYRTYKLSTVTVRPFNTYGPRQSARAVIPTIITQALTKNSVRLGCLDARRDFTYVDDSVNGFLKAASTPGVEGQTFNLGTGRDVNIGELAKKIIEITERPVEIDLDPARLRPKKSEVMRLISDNTLAQQYLEWWPEVSLDEGLRQTVNWIKNNLTLFRPGVYES